MQIANQYSAVMALIFPFGLIGLAVARRHKPFISRLAGGLGLLLLTLIGFYLLQPEPGGTSVDETTQLLAIGSGQPLFVELYSDY